MSCARRIARVVRRAGLASALLLAGVAGPAGSGASAGIDRTVPSAPTSRRADGLVLLERDFELAAQDILDLVVRLPAGLDSATVGADGRVVELDVVAYGALTDRKDVGRIRAGDAVAATRRPSDTSTVPLAVATADPRVTDRSAPSQIAVAIAVEAVDSVAGLQLPREGVYPIGVVLRVDGRAVAEAITFVHRRSAAGSNIADLPVAILMAQTAPPSVTEDGSLLLSTSELIDLTRLTESLEALDAAAAAAGGGTVTSGTAPTIARGALVQPASLQALAELDPTLAARLVAVLARSELVAAPKLPLDPSAIVAAGRPQIYTDWLRAGEDIVASIVPATRTDRSLYLADGTISEAGARYLAGTGVDAVVMGPDLYAATDGSIDDYGDPTWLQTIELDDGSTMPVLRIDPYIGEQLDARPADPRAAAVDLLAEVLTYRHYLDSIGRSVPNTGLLLARTDAGAIEPALAREIADLLLRIDGVDVVSPGDLVAGMDSQLVAGTLGALAVPSTAGDDLTARLETIDRVTFESVAIGYMLPDGDGHVAQWESLIETMPSSGLADEEVERMASSLQASYDEFRNGVVGPDPFKFTLTGRTGTIRFRLVNTTDVTLRVLVRLDGAKLTFPENDRVYDIEPNSFTSVEAEAESRSNGTSQVIVRLLTPTGLQISDDIVLTAQVRALTGLGQLLTGACLLVLATWWVRHWRLIRRRRASDDTSVRHPAVRGRRPHIADDASPELREPSDVIEADQLDERGPGPTHVLAPDAAASSLPPS